MRIQIILMLVWQIGSIATFGYLTSADYHTFNLWNWIIILPVNLFLGEIWPIYWLILRPIFGV